MTKIPKVPETTAPQVQTVQVPVQIFLHQAAFGITKLPTPEGVFNELTFVSPTGIAVTIRLDEHASKELVKQLTGIETATVQDLHNMTGI
jgi:hypothetical protein